MSTPQSFAYGNQGDMNASLWGELQNFIDLSMIFTKLPLAPFFRLRQVCKEWNCLASNRQFLEQNFKPPISSNPYFIIKCLSGRQVLLTCEGSSWSSMPMPQARHEVSGLLFEDSNRNRIFDLHTRVFHNLPPFTALVQDKQGNLDNSLIGMVVDTIVIPYKFKVVIGNHRIGTGIYDSNNGTWMHNLSTRAYRVLTGTGGKSCVQHNNFLHILIGNAWNSWTNVQTYDLERDEWNFQEIRIPMDAVPSFNIGVLPNRWFGFAMNLWKLDVVVWVIPSEPRINFDRMPIDLYKWILMDFKCLHIMFKFCGRHVLLYNKYTSEKRGILYNLDQKTWDKIELPITPMSQ